MTSTHSIKTEISSRYSAALFELALERKELDKIEKDLKSFVKMYEESEDLRFMLDCPTIPKNEKQKAIIAIATKSGFTKTTIDFLGTVAGNNRLFALPSMIDAFFALIAKKNGILAVSVISAVDLSSDQKKEITDSLAASLGKGIDLSVKVDAHLLGGLMIKIGSLLIDSSLKTRLQQLKMVMKGA